ncbi:MAG: ATP-binding protein [Gammaproteobacteria bacterium]
MLDVVPAVLSGHLYRLVQESLNNASNHAEATHVQTRITITPDVPTSGVATRRVERVVEDDGVAIVSPAEEDYGIGLRGMKDRVTALGGQWSLEGRAPSGSSFAFFCR